MGCVASRIDQEERVRVCKERKRLIKHLLKCRQQFAHAQLAYLRSLKNTGATLRQFTDSESLEIDDNASAFGFPPSPPPPLPPSPPPLPTFSPDLAKFEEDKQPQPQSNVEEDIIETDEDSKNSPPPPIPTSSWDYWDPFASPSSQCVKRSETVEQVEDENWVDTNSDFIDGEDDDDDDEVNLLHTKQDMIEVLDDSSSMMSWHTKDTADAMVVWRSKKNLSSIVKDLDEYFLKASDVVKEIAVFIDIDAGGTFTYQNIEENKRKRSSSAKVFSALTWSWSSRSLQPTRQMGFLYGPDEPCKPGAHCVTLQKLYLEEQKLYKNVREDEITKVEHTRKCLLLQRQEEDHEWAKAEKTRSTVESLLSYILSLQESISKSISTILQLINDELYPQLITLASGLMDMWKTMHNCHQVQYHISQLLNQVIDQQNMEPTTECHRQAAAQLQTEVTSWYHSICEVIKFQQEYVKVLFKWTKLTECLKDINNPNSGSSTSMHSLIENWLQALDKLPDKIVSEAINCLVSSVQDIVLQQHEECNMHKRTDKLRRKLEKELTILSDVEMKFAGSFTLEDATSISTPKHPLYIRRAKVEALKKLVDDENTKYLNSVKMTRTMILSNLQTSLPKVFQALMVYSDAYAQNFEAFLTTATTSGHEDVQTLSG